jgi:hypothetical protein
MSLQLFLSPARISHLSFLKASWHFLNSQKKDIKTASLHQLLAKKKTIAISAVWKCGAHFCKRLKHTTWNLYEPN